MALYVKGDIHGNPSSFSSSAFPEGKTLTREDYVLILGDFGMVWNYKGETANESYWLDWLEDKPWTTLFIDGNHENFDRLDALPQADWHGGRVSYIRPHILHLKRGYVFDIDGCKCFCMGGASSHDIRDGILDIEKDAKLIKQWEKDYFKLFRINKVSWWEQELPNEEEMKRGFIELEKNNWEVDFIFSHCASTSTENMLRASGILPLGIDTYPDKLNNYLQEVEDKTTFKKHYFGHYHSDESVYGCGGKQILLYNNIERIN